MMTADTASPTYPSIIRSEAASIVPSPKVVRRVDVRVSMDTQAAASPIALVAEKTGLWYFLYLILLAIAAVKAVKDSPQSVLKIRDALLVKNRLDGEELCRLLGITEK